LAPKEAFMLNNSMRTIISIAVLTFLLVTAPGVCFAEDVIDIVSKERAKELGMEIRAKAAGPDAVRVELEFELKGKLKRFSHVDLEMRDGEKLLVSSTLQEERSRPGRVVVRFAADRSNLDKLTLQVLVQENLGRAVYVIRVKEFVDLEKVRLGGANRPEEEAAEWRKLEGTWKIVILDADGERFEGGFGDFDCILIEKRKLIAKGADRAQEWGTLTIDHSTSPKLMDLREAAEAAKGNTAEGIYELERDRLRICMDRRSTDVKERPTQFPKDPQKGVLFLVLERQKR
jgi:uncharacterized protein (TIGR03067 family)